MFGQSLSRQVLTFVFIFISCTSGHDKSIHKSFVQIQGTCMYNNHRILSNNPTLFSALHLARVIRFVLVEGLFGYEQTKFTFFGSHWFLKYDRFGGSQVFRSKRCFHFSSALIVFSSCIRKMSIRMQKSTCECFFYIFTFNKIFKHSL